MSYDIGSNSKAAIRESLNVPLDQSIHSRMQLGDLTISVHGLLQLDESHDG